MSQQINIQQMRPNAPKNEDYVDISDEAEVRYWTRYFKVTREQLIAAVNRRGNRFDDVKRSLGRYS